jgi:hypothetical protein
MVIQLAHNFSIKIKSKRSGVSRLAPTGMRQPEWAPKVAEAFAVGGVR